MRLAPRFPYGRPAWPSSVPRPPVERRTGIHYDTTWSRRYPARLARVLAVEGVLRPIVRVLADPTVTGTDRLDAVEPPAIFAANHASHLDTPLLLTSLPERFRHRTVVAAGADYFFDSRLKGAMSALAMAAIPMDRTRVSRRSADQAAALLQEGWNLVIFPEGGRTPDGWAQPFRGGAAYLSLRCGVPVVPVHLEGTGRVMRKGAKRPTPSRTTVTFGRPLASAGSEDARRFAVRVEEAVAALADEQATDWWSARRRAAAGATPALSGPTAGAWRRAWALGQDGGLGRRRSTPAPGSGWPFTRK